MRHASILLQTDSEPVCKQDKSSPSLPSLALHALVDVSCACLAQPSDIITCPDALLLHSEDGQRSFVGSHGERL